MMAMLWAQQIMLGKKTYGQVQDYFKEQGKRNLGRFRNGRACK